jgi:hypothetical protein
MCLSFTPFSSSLDSLGLCWPGGTGQLDTRAYTQMRLPHASCNACTRPRGSSRHTTRGDIFACTHCASRCAHTATSRAGRLAGWRGDVCLARAGSRTVFRLPPPIPGKPGGGYPQEWHSAQTTIKRNYVAHMERKRARAPVMQEVVLCVRGGKPPRPPARWRRLRVFIACSFQQIRRPGTLWPRAWPCFAGTSNLLERMNVGGGRSSISL